MAHLSGLLPELTMGLQSLLVHKLRSLLTMLGMIFGVGAVVLMLAVGQGAQNAVKKQIDSMGSHLFIILAFQPHCVQP